jgi:hypothetical protein
MDEIGGLPTGSLLFANGIRWTMNLAAHISSQRRNIPSPLLSSPLLSSPLLDE